jgi:hypothetical protein
MDYRLGGPLTRSDPLRPKREQSTGESHNSAQAQALSAIAAIPSIGKRKNTA